MSRSRAAARFSAWLLPARSSAPTYFSIRPVWGIAGCLRSLPEGWRSAKIARALRRASSYSGGMLGSPSKVHVRAGKPADATALARIFKDSWLLAYRGIIPHLHLESMVRQRTPEWWREALTSGDGTLV